MFSRKIIGMLRSNSTCVTHQNPNCYIICCICYAYPTEPSGRVAPAGRLSPAPGPATYLGLIAILGAQSAGLLSDQIVLQQARLATHLLHQAVDVVLQEVDLLTATGHLTRNRQPRGHQVRAQTAQFTLMRRGSQCCREWFTFSKMLCS